MNEKMTALYARLAPTLDSLNDGLTQLEEYFRQNYKPIESIWVYPSPDLAVGMDIVKGKWRLCLGKPGDKGVKLLGPVLEASRLYRVIIAERSFLWILDLQAAALKSTEEFGPRMEQALRVLNITLEELKSE